MLRSALAATVVLAVLAVVPALADTVPYSRSGMLARQSTTNTTGEPTGLLLLGTGIVGAAGVVRLRSARS